MKGVNDLVFLMLCPSYIASLKSLRSVIFNKYTIILLNLTNLEITASNYIACSKASFIFADIILLFGKLDAERTLKMSCHVTKSRKTLFR